MPVRTRAAARPATPPVPPAPPAKPKQEFGPKEPGSLSGNLTADPDLRFTPSGLAVCNFGIAVNERIQLEDGTWEDADPEFFRITAWRDLGERCAEHLLRGDRIIAIGNFQDRTYVDKEGEKRTVTEFTAEDIGPSFRFRGAEIKRVTRDKPSSARTPDKEIPF
jgi:single-strand DNA-binding protein